jgi:hypothetical protein
MLLKWTLTAREKTAEMKMLFLALALAMSISHTACGADNRLVSSAPSRQPNEVSNEQVESMKIRIKIEDKVVTATLTDSKTTRDFISLLPLTLTLEDYAGTEKISYLPRKLSTEDAPSGSDPSVGDIAYYAPWGNLAIFYKDFRYSDGLVILGKIDGGMEAFNAPGSAKVTVELVK